MANQPANMGWPALGGPLDELSGRRMSNALNSLPLVRPNKPDVDVKLDDQQSGCFVPSYTTLDKIQGQVCITCEHDTPYDGVHVIFQGSTKTFAEKIATSAPTIPRTRAYHNFLRLVQPLDEGGAGAELPPDQILKAGKTYHVPFTFVVPENLLPQACTHEKANDSVMLQHLVPPPSFGDPMMAGDGKSLLDDFAPDMAMVRYGIRVILTRRERSNSAGHSKVKSVADVMKKLRIIPATEEQPPLTPQADGDDYVLSRTKQLKKGIFKGKLGTLSMTAPQPTPLRLPFIRSTDVASGHTTTMAHVDLLFEPATPTAKPPKLGQLWAKLKIATFYATVPMKDFPSKSLPFMYDSQRGIFVDTLPLSNRCVATTQWTKVDPALTRRDSGVSVPSTPQGAAIPRGTVRETVGETQGESHQSETSQPEGPSSEATQEATPPPPPPPAASDSPATPTGLHYTARVLVPVDLPTSSKTFIATFHSCLLSRIYALDLALQTQSPPASVAGKKVPGVSAGGGSTLHLKLPLQILQEGNADAAPIISDAEAAHIRAREMDHAFVPRSTAPPGHYYYSATPLDDSFEETIPQNVVPQALWSEGAVGQGTAAEAGATEVGAIVVGAADGTAAEPTPTEATAPTEQLADLHLRGARGSVFSPPRWGSVSWGSSVPPAHARAAGRRCGGGDHIAGDPARSPSDALWSSRSSDEDDIVEEPASVDAALHDDAPAQNTHRSEAARRADAPPGYSAFNGVVTRGSDANSWI